jgi:hypothetical protein
MLRSILLASTLTLASGAAWAGCNTMNCFPVGAPQGTFGPATVGNTPGNPPPPKTIPGALNLLSNTTSQWRDNGDGTVSFVGKQGNRSFHGILRGIGPAPVASVARRSRFSWSAHGRR